MRFSLFSIAVGSLTLAGAHAQTVGSFTTNGTGCPIAVSDINAADDTVSVGFNLGFNFPYRGGLGSTSVIDIAPNGYIYFESGTNTATRCCQGATAGVPVTDFFSATPSFAAFGHDLNVATTSTSGNGAIWFETDGIGLATISWDMANDFGATPVTPNTFQVQLRSDGTIICDYTATGFTAQALVGYSEGNGVTDGGGSDLSAGTSGVGGTAVYEVFDPATGEDLSGGALLWVPNAAGSYDVVRLGPSAVPCCVAVESLAMNATGIPTEGQSFTWNLTGVPASSLAGVIFVGTPAGGLPLGLIGMNGCFLYSNPFVTIPASLTAPTGTASLTFGPGSSGLTLETQAAIIAPGTNALGVVTSNGGTVAIGNTNPVRVRCDGANSFNLDTSFGFFSITNGRALDIVSLTVDFNAALPGKVFDLDQTGMADRFDGGDAGAAACANTYRNASDISTGLVYVGTAPAGGACGGTGTGFVPSNPFGAASQFETLTFTFTSFNMNDRFEFDADTDGVGGVGGDDMAGMVWTVTFSDSSVVSGSVVVLAPDLGGVDL